MATRGADATSAAFPDRSPGCSLGSRDDPESRVEVAVARGEGLRIWLLGGFQVEAAGRLVVETAWRRNRARALVKLLALAPAHRLHREQLVDILWPELDGGAGAANLRKAAYFTRQAMGPQWLHTHGDVVALSPVPWVDVLAFEEAAQAGRTR